MVGPALRRAVVSTLKETPSLTALVGDRIYGERTPTAKDLVRPFVVVGVAIETPLMTGCRDGATIDFAVSVYDDTKNDSRATAVAFEVINAIRYREQITFADGAIETLTRTTMQGLTPPNGEDIQFLLRYAARVSYL